MQDFCICYVLIKINEQKIQNLNIKSTPKSEKVGERLGKGKKTGKIVFTIAGFALGGVGGAMGWWGNGVRFLSGAMYGMSIASTLWSVTQKPNAFGNLDGDYSQDDYSKFSTTTNDISQDAVIPVIYGTRKWGGCKYGITPITAKDICRGCWQPNSSGNIFNDGHQEDQKFISQNKRTEFDTISNSVLFYSIKLFDIIPWR